MAVMFDKGKCDQNPFCSVTRVCPSGAMYIDKKTYRPSFDAEKCTGCSVCVSKCPHGAMSER